MVVGVVSQAAIDDVGGCVEPFARREHARRPQLLGEHRTFGRGLDRDDARARERQQRDEHQPDRPGSDHDRTLAREDRGLSCAVDDGRERLRECRHVCGEIGRDGMALRRRDPHLRRQAAVREDAERREALAVIASAAAAGPAGAARDIRRDDDAVAHVQVGRVRPCVGDDADEFVAEHDADLRRMARRVAEDLEVAAADATRLDVEHDIRRGVDLRHGPLEDLEPARAREDRGAHRRRGSRHASAAGTTAVPASSCWSSVSSCPPAISRTSCSWSTSRFA